MTPAPANGKVAWITGAGKGIGRALALRLAAEGWTVAASARTTGDLARLAAECPQGRVHPFPLDVTAIKPRDGAVDDIERKLAPIDLAVLNAGTHTPMTAEEFSVATVRSLMEVNFFGTANCLEQLIPRFIERRRGHIAVVASLAGYRGLPTAAAYGASKAALINMCESLRPELERHGVRLTLINPGFVRTPLTDRNRFHMPFLIDADDAALHICRGLDRSGFEVSFPWRFAAAMKLLRLLPDRLFFMLSRRMIRE
jgi:short-subunit dehydrogenase